MASSSWELLEQVRAWRFPLRAEETFVATCRWLVEWAMYLKYSHLAGSALTLRSP